MWSRKSATPRANTNLCTACLAPAASGMPVPGWRGLCPPAPRCPVLASQYLHPWSCWCTREELVFSLFSGAGFISDCLRYKMLSVKSQRLRTPRGDNASAVAGVTQDTDQHVLHGEVVHVLRQTDRAAKNRQCSLRHPLLHLLRGLWDWKFALLVKRGYLEGSDHGMAQLTDTRWHLQSGQGMFGLQT